MNWVVMGVSGCGKTTVGAAFARAIGAVFVDGDDLHPLENVAKMASGQPLTDADRWPWLDQVAGVLTGNVVVGCSALKRTYRDRIRAGAGPVRFLHLAGSQAVIAALPRNPSGKILRRELREPYWAGRERQIN